MHLSLVIPAYNEEKRIGETLRGACAYLAAQQYNSEIIVVDDGSRDATRALVEREFPRIRVVSYQPNCGKGHAVKKGMMAATGDFRVYFDADASTPIEELEKLWPRFEAGADIVIGSRALPNSDVQLHQTWYRENMGRFYNVILRTLGLTRFRDTQCGFKGYTAPATQIVFPRVTFSSYSFDAEALFIAELHGLRIEEVPVRWINSPHTRVNPITDASRMLRDILTIRQKARQGQYA
ncbi:MAG: glycosyltransferase family 2 protein [Candidatus Hydrogenedentes bacterium]|nr:glycosyltransferase family 2 protein [Candidatus Hydrogenedentota bacterium]